MELRVQILNSGCLSTSNIFYHNKKLLLMLNRREIRYLFRLLEGVVVVLVELKINAAVL